MTCQFNFCFLIWSGFLDPIEQIGSLIVCKKNKKIPFSPEFGNTIVIDYRQK